MKEEIFESLGLSPNEAKIYESLVEKGESSVSEIAINAQIHRRNAYDAIRRLVDKGLAFEIVSRKENRYNAVDPNKLLELFKEKENELEKILPDLQKKFIQRVAPEEAYIYRGLEGQKNIWRDVLRVGENSYFIGAKGTWLVDELLPSREAFFKEANRKKIKFFQVFDQSVKTHPEIYKRLHNYPAAEFENRFLPKEFSTNSSIHIFGDYVATYTGIVVGEAPHNVVFFVIRSKNLAESYRTWFKALWAQSTEVIKSEPNKSKTPA